MLGHFLVGSYRAPDYVGAVRLAAAHDAGDDYVIGTGVSPTVGFSEVMQRMVEADLAHIPQWPRSV